MAAGLAVSAAVLVAAPSAFAAETVAVKLVGERGGKMSIELDKASVPAGEVTFKVVNIAKNTPHEMVVIKLDSAGQKLKVDPDTNKVDESKLKSLGEVEGLKAGQSGDLKVQLEPGNYELICNYKGHVMAGMVVPFTVKAASS
ncbi:copper resistance protein [Aureimonas leprariae]|uniref:Copper resistance protein n=2 Tax=Plantimonas leprariae TaxID=2615207 RepID=A0A7V7TW28_9HYPH|nr:copper resistance protein [Aureimonas leprariae]